MEGGAFVVSDQQQIIEVELDPIGYVPRPDLFVRNLSPQTITFNMGKIRWTLPPFPNPDYEQPLPWTVARSSGFGRLWARGQVLVAGDEEFTLIVNDLPEGGSLFRPFVHRQEVAQSVVDIDHDLNRRGPVMVSVFSLDGQTEYFNFHTEMLTENRCRVSFDDPISFVATIF
ncbi:hypothetical protein PLEIONE_117 [Mycobacterium phage Pleione]|uniref:Uncharacterized protein n=12 Tax=Bixzunavirus TaxID=680114 RepID=R4TK48_9CAUD|nr:hypothetical protein ET08_102 [Mycobacterium phage ET08]YP_008061602.1 hypothetical protein M182_gp208 [Mycobacterium phage Astraea]YP_009016574.1 hypothetical protein NAPPY_116 [Mycobacterium phage Nappy]YP_009017886.1 hypothetical protein PLEIONE_117 [Mycobacterium phage Pleione]YP_009216366.1 hypothetical protein ALICE_106 [Mycobacterium phage Alice]YP_010057750.1 hypothetical protein KHO61_gp208 [Mycobacterium phage Mangeria]YP_010058203.1 hypothetical protein KHO63_gp199 [Mycobacteriu